MPASRDHQLFPPSWNVQIPPPPSRRTASTGELMRRTMKVMRERFVDVALIVASTAGGAFALQTLSGLLIPKPAIGATFSWTPVLWSLLVGLLAGVLMVWLQTSLTLLAGSERFGVKLSLSDALKQGLEAVPAGVATRVVQGVVLVIAFLALVVPAIILMVRFSLAMQISTFERRIGLDALRASNELVRDGTFAVFVRLFKFWIVQVCAAIAAGLGGAVLIGVALGAVKVPPTLAASVGIIFFLVLAGFAVAFYSIWRTHFYLAIVDEQRALAPVPLPDDLESEPA
jgi:hypothetical protein